MIDRVPLSQCTPSVYKRNEASHRNSTPDSKWFSVISNSVLERIRHFSGITSETFASEYFVLNLVKFDDGSGEVTSAFLLLCLPFIWTNLYFLRQKCFCRIGFSLKLAGGFGKVTNKFYYVGEVVWPFIHWWINVNFPPQKFFYRIDWN